ncbi:MAG TPA: hypothetical protein VF632_24965 [Longimicrobium sp.]
MNLGECVFCDWTYDPFAEPWLVCLPHGTMPMFWTGSGIETVRPSDSIAETIPGVSTVVHWAREHPDQLLALIGPFEMHRWSTHW